MRTVLLITLLLFPFTAFAQNRHPQTVYYSIPVEKPTDAIADDIKTTWFELVEKVFPGARLDDATGKITAKHSIPLRQIWRASGAESKELQGDFIIPQINALWIRSAGKDHLTLLVQVEDAGKVDSNDGDNYALAVFSFAPRLALVDAINPKKTSNDKTDFDRSFPLLSIDKKSRDDAFFVTNTRKILPDGSEKDIVLVALQKGRLQFVSDYFTEGIKREYCKSEKEQNWTHIDLRGRARYIRYNFYFTEQATKWGGKSCEEGGYADSSFYHRHTFRLYWDAQKKRYQFKLLEIESSGAYSPVDEMKEIIDFHGQTFNVGRFYRGQMRYDRRRGWRLITKYSYSSLDRSARIRWFDEKRVLPTGEIKNGTERTIIFKVITSRTLFFREKFPQLVVYQLLPWSVER